MNTTAEMKLIHRVAHKMLDDLLDTAEALLECLAEEWTEDLKRLTRERSTAVPSVAPTGSPKEQIVLDEPPPKPGRVKPAPRRRQQYPDVTISCRRSCERLEIAVNLSPIVVERLGLKPHGKVDFDMHRGKLRVRRGAEGGRTLYSGGTTSRLFFSVWADSFGVAERHDPESCSFQYDLEDALLIDPPTWLKGVTATARSVKQPTKNPKNALPVSCRKLLARTSALKCSACGKGATLLCSRCENLICDACWESHVRTHWNTEHHGKAGSAAHDARQAMRSDA